MSLPNSCPLCGASYESQFVVTTHVYGRNSGVAFFHCHQCDVRYQYPRLTHEEESQFYEAEFEKFMDTRSGERGGWLRVEEHIKVNEPTRLRRMKYLTPYLRDSAKILEVGCSSGFMLYPLIQSGYPSMGIEPSGIFSQFIEDRGLRNFRSLDDLLEKMPTSRFDLIIHFFVLEHISEPVSFLRKQLTCLNRGGSIIFEVPNVADPLYSVYDIPAFERFYWSVAHPWYFSEDSLKFILDQLGHPYQIILDQRYDLSNHITWARDGRPGGMGRFTNLLGEEIEVQYKQALVKNRKCDTLIGIVTKGD